MPPPRRSGGQGSSPGGPAALAARALPALALPFLVGVLQPLSGSAALPLVLVASALGIVVSVAVPHARLSALVVLLLTGLLLCVGYVQVLEDEHPPPAMGGTALRTMSEAALQPSSQEAAAISAPAAEVVPEAAKGTGQGHGADVKGADGAAAAERASHERVASLRWRAQSGVTAEHSDALETFSVVLPCAFEGEFAEKTVRAIWENTKHARLKEILVVDDGSKPPLQTIFSKELLAGGPGLPNVRIIRHDRTLGLIAAKQSGGDAAIGDVITFFDCHVSPRKGWEDAMLKQMARAGDHRTVVVPTITSLDPNTWREIHNGAAGKSCWVEWNADFTWLSNPGRDAPLMSGGLLALSRKWWAETGGYDPHMVAWGGENIDQSLRTWLCGGRIEVAEDSFVAHMWRDQKNPKTMLKYPIPTKDVMRNKARATKAWFSEFAEKVFSFPEYDQFVKEGVPLGDMSPFDEIKERLKCKPFSHYIQRFPNVYLETGMIPTDIFQIREKKTGLCMQRIHGDQQPHRVGLVPCGGGEGGGPVPELQWWHSANRDPTQNGACCSGIMNWNFLQCLDAAAIGQKLRSFSCEIQGRSQNQIFSLENPAGEGQLLWRKGTKRAGCVGSTLPSDGKACMAALHRCAAHVVPVGDELLHLPSGEELPRFFHLRTSSVLTPSGEETCATAAGGDGNSVSGFELQFVKCDEHDSSQRFQTRDLHGGVQIKVGETDSCLDSASGARALVYPCYADTVRNLNQVWHIRENKLVWDLKEGTMCVDGQATGKSAFRPSGAFAMETCTPKSGQVLKKHEEQADGSFRLRDPDSGACLAQGTARDARSDGLAMGDCGERERWEVLPGSGQLRHVASGRCLDAGGGSHQHANFNPALHDCHQRRGGPSQQFEYVEEPGWLRMAGTFGDNGRKRWFEKCLDHKPQEPLELTIQSCDAARKAGLTWERANVQIPLERELWEKAEKPAPSDPPLGGGVLSA